MMLFVDLHLYWLLHVLGVLARGENHEGEAACRNLGRDFELNGCSALLHNLYRDIIFPICQEDLGNVFFLEILSPTVITSPALPLPGSTVDMRGIGCRA